MGLKERKAVQEFQETRFNNWKNEIQNAAGFTPEFEIEWDTMAVDGQSHLFEEGFQKVYFEPIVNALKAIASDKMGADALKAGLKKIHVCNKSGYYSPGQAITFESGVLKIDHEPTSNMSDIEPRQKKIQDILEKNL